MSQELELVVSDLLSPSVRSQSETAVSDRLRHMASVERRDLNAYIQGRAGLLRGFERRSNAQENELNQLEALGRDVLGAERDHVRNLGTGADAGRIESGTPYADHAQNRTQGDGLRDQARRIIEAGFRAKELPDYAAERAERLVSTGPARDQGVAGRWALAAGAPEYRTAFAKLLGDPTRGHMLWDAQEQEAYRRVVDVQTEMRAMTLTDSAGGYMVPLSLDPAIMLTSDGSINPLRQISRVVQTVSDVWNGITSAGVTAEWTAEAAEVADASPTLGQPTIPVYKGDAFVPFSFEIGMDGLNFLQELQGLLMDGADQLMNTAYTTGSGSAQPTGIITALVGTASEINGAGSEVLSAADPYTLQNALPPRFQSRAQWCANIAIINTLSQFETTSGALKFPSVHDNPPMLLRKALNELSNMDGSINAAATANNFCLLYGDFQQFVIVDRIGATLELVPHLFGSTRRPTGQRGALLWFRTGSDSVNDAAFRMLDVPTTA